MRLFIAILFAFSLTVFAEQSQPPSPTPAKSRNPPQKSTTKPDDPITNNQSVTINIPSSIQQFHTSPGSQDTKSEANSVEDKSSPDWWIAFFTGVAALATFALAIITFLLVRYTKKLWGATSELVRGAEETAQRQLRAYVHFVNFIVGGGQALKEGEDNWQRITPIWRNSGCTPTRHMTIWRNHYFGPTAPKIDFDSTEGGTIEHLLAGPNYEFVGDDIRLPWNATARIITGKDRLFVWGWADYNDVFRNTKRHRTEFCVEVAVSVTTDPDPSKRYIFTSRAYGQFNGADDDCYRQPKPYQA